MTYLPPESLSQAADALQALLKIVADPAAHADKVAELKAHADAAKEAFVGAQANQRDADAARQEAERALRQLREEKAAFEANSLALARDLDNREQAITQREAAMKAKEQEHGDQSRSMFDSLEAKEQELDRREAELAQREPAVAELEAKVKAMEADLATRIQRSRELWGG